MNKHLYPAAAPVAFLLGMVLLLGSSFHAGAQAVKTQVITTYVGNGDTGYTGNGGAATLAKLNSPTAIATDAAGNLYISDQKNNCVRKVSPGGSIITTIAGSHAAGYGGDNGPATLAMLNLNWGVGVDGAGNVYISDEQNQRIRKVSATTGIITTIAGDGTRGYYGDNGPATLAKLQFPLGIAVDGAGNVYFGDAYNFCIRKIDPAGIITTVAGTGTNGFSGDGTPATNAELSSTWGLATDAAGNVYFCDGGNNRVREISTAGIITTVAGTGGIGNSGDGSPATLAEFNEPIGVYVSPAGNMYIADFYNNSVRMVNAAGIISTIAGNGLPGYSGDGGVATAAELNNPIAVTMDDSGNVYITDLNNTRIRKISNVNVLSFINGDMQQITVCENVVAAPINNALSIVDYDTGPVDTWSLLSAPVHGSVVAAYSAASSGGTVTPVGLSYTPVSGYVGNDTFAVRVTNGIMSDTTTVSVSVNTLFPSAGTITGVSHVCEKGKVTLTDPITGGVWSSSNTHASVSGGVVTGVSAGVDTLLYTYNNSCAVAIATKTMTIDPLPDPGKITGASAVCSGSTITITDAAGGGKWSTSNGTASVDSGIVTGVSAGTDTIIYTVINAFCTASTTVTLTIDTVTIIGNISGADSVCVGAKITLTDGMVRGGIWGSSDTLASVSSGIVMGKAAGTDTISYSITNSCGTAMATKVITINPLPDTPFINQNEYLLTVNSGYTSYAWVRNSAAIPGATIDTYRVTNAGTYSVMVTNQYGCAVASQPVIASDCSTDDILIYPNPAQSIIYIKWCKQLTVRIIEMNGKIFKAMKNVNEIDLRDMPNGDYLLSLFDENGHKIKTQCISKITN